MVKIKKGTDALAYSVSSPQSVRAHKGAQRSKSSAKTHTGLEFQVIPSQQRAYSLSLGTKEQVHTLSQYLSRGAFRKNAYCINTRNWTVSSVFLELLFYFSISFQKSIHIVAIYLQSPLLYSFLNQLQLDFTMVPLTYPSLWPKINSMLPKPVASVLCFTQPLERCSMVDNISSVFHDHGFPFISLAFCFICSSVHNLSVLIFSLRSFIG